MDPAVQFRQPSLQFRLVLFPRHAVHSRCSITLQRVEAVPQRTDRHMVEQRGELRPFSFTCNFTHTVQVAQLADPALSPGRGRLHDVLLGRSPSLHALRRRLPTIVRTLRRCRVGGGALARWPPSAAQTARAVFPHAAFTKMVAMKVQAKGLTEQDLPARTRRKVALQADVSSPHNASAVAMRPDAPS